MVPPIRFDLRGLGGGHHHDVISNEEAAAWEIKRAASDLAGKEDYDFTQS